MRRVAAFFVLAASLFFAAPAQAFNPCPKSTIGWAQQWINNAISSASYDSAAQVLYVVFNNFDQEVLAFSGVPIGVIQAFTINPKPLFVYQTYVLPRYREIFVSQKVNCPILFENGTYIWTE